MSAHTHAHVQDDGTLHTECLTKEDVETIVGEILNTLEGEVTPKELSVYVEMEKIHELIEHMKEEIRAVRPDEIQESHLPQAKDELTAVVQATEDATGRILDAAEIIEEVAGKLEGEHQDRLLQAATAIYEASNFQDITGQRITKVTTALRVIDDKISALLSAFSPDGSAPKKAPEPKEEKPKTDADLLNGPQLSDSATSQDDIDALFNTL